MTLWKVYTCFLAVLLLLSSTVAVTWHIQTSEGDLCNASEYCIAIDEAFANVSDGDIIAFNDSYRGLTCENRTVNLSGSIRVVGDGLFRYGCEDRESVLNVIGDLETVQRISFERVVLTNVHIRLVDVSLAVDDVECFNCTITVDDGRSKVAHTVEVVSLRMRGFRACSGHEACGPYGRLHMVGPLERMTIRHSEFKQTEVLVKVSSDVEVDIWNCTFDNDLDSDLPVMGGLVVGLWEISNNSSVQVRNSIFQNQFNWSPVDSVINIFESALRIFRFPHGDVHFAHISVLIENCSFKNNERAVTLQGDLGSVMVEDSSFIGNIAVHAGAGILMLTRSIAIRRCKFLGNSAGQLRDTGVLPAEDSVVIHGDVVRVDSTCCKGSVALIGKGGALRVQHGVAIVENSTFYNNSARIAGGSVFVDRESQLELYTCRMSNSPSVETMALQGDIIYSNGHVIVDGVTIHVLSALAHTSLFQHSGDRWSVEVYDISLRCPTGHNFRVTNTSSYRVVDNKGLKRSYKLDQLSYHCTPCPQHKYSIDHGHMSYSLDQGVLDYFALMINEEYPEESKHERYLHRDIVCKACPYGGTCETEIKALPDFWGYTFNGEVFFQQCRKGYCCSKINTCTTYNTCAPHRTGRLCGICEDGYTEALFSPKCVPNDTCGPLWIWPFTFITALLCVLFLFFQKDIREFLFGGELFWCSRNCSSKIKSRGEVQQELDDVTKVTETEIKLLSDDDKILNGLHVSGTEVPHSNVGSLSGISSITKGSVCIQDSSSSTDIGSIILILVLYYFQDAMLFHVQMINIEPEDRGWSKLKMFLLSLFQFRLDVTHFIDNVCMMVGLTASQKLLAKAMMVPFVLIIFVVFYFGYVVLKSARSAKLCSDVMDGKSDENFLTKLSSGFMLALLFMYQRLATTTFQLLNCVEVGSDSVLFVEGAITCYQNWQLGVVAYAIVCIIPFSFVLMLGPCQLKARHISVFTYFVSCICPLPFVVYWVGCRLCKRNSIIQTQDGLSPAESAVVKVMHGPFRDISNRFIGPVCWAGVLIFRRLVLILFFTFINNSLIRIICMLFFCFCILLIHVNVAPYRDRGVNFAGTMSISALMVVGGINLIRASFEVAEYVPQGPNETLVLVLRELENVLMLWVPLITMSAILLLLIVKIVLLALKLCKA